MKINATARKTASFLALFLGVMSVFAGTRVLLGIDTKNYVILNWLVRYNVILGVVSIIAALLIWKQKKQTPILISTILTMHFFVLIYLKYFSNVAANESIKAMIFRTFIWFIIIFLILLLPKLNTKK